MGAYIRVVGGESEDLDLFVCDFFVKKRRRRRPRLLSVPQGPMGVKIKKCTLLCTLF